MAIMQEETVIFHFRNTNTKDVPITPTFIGF